MSKQKSVNSAAFEFSLTLKAHLHGLRIGATTGLVLALALAVLRVILVLLKTL